MSCVLQWIFIYIFALDCTEKRMKKINTVEKLLAQIKDTEGFWIIGKATGTYHLLGAPEELYICRQFNNQYAAGRIIPITHKLFKQLKSSTYHPQVYYALNILDLTRKQNQQRIPHTGNG